MSGIEIPDQTGRTAVITGANSGIGLAAARALAGAGARVILAVRDVAAGERAAGSLPGTGHEVRPLDLASLQSIASFADAWSDPVDLLVNNAGVMIPPLGRTADGFETQFGVNHLGHFALTGRLLGHVRGRVVTVSSSAHRLGGIDFDDPNWERRRYRAWRAYGQSKLANLLFCAELQRRLAAAGSDVLSTAAHPGYAATGLQRHGDPLNRSLMWIGNHTIAQDAAGGALPTLSAALAELPGAAYVGPSGPGEVRGAPQPVGRSRAALDPELARRLWELSERLTGVHPGAPAGRTDDAARG